MADIHPNHGQKQSAAQEPPILRAPAARPFLSPSFHSPFFCSEEQKERKKEKEKEGEQTTDWEVFVPFY